MKQKYFHAPLQNLSHCSRNPTTMGVLGESRQKGDVLWERASCRLYLEVIVGREVNELVQNVTKARQAWGR